MNGLSPISAGFQRIDRILQGSLTWLSGAPTPPINRTLVFAQYTIVGVCVKCFLFRFFPDTRTLSSGDVRSCIAAKVHRVLSTYGTSSDKQALHAIPPGSLSNSVSWNCLDNHRMMDRSSHQLGSHTLFRAHSHARRLRVGRHGYNPDRVGPVN